MIRIYLEGYYNTKVHDETPWSKPPTRVLTEDVFVKKDNLVQWLNSNTSLWEWGITHIYDGIPRCVYLENSEDATAFCLTFDIFNIIHERNQ